MAPNIVALFYYAALAKRLLFWSLAIGLGLAVGLCAHERRVAAHLDFQIDSTEHVAKRYQTQAALSENIARAAVHVADSLRTLSDAGPRVIRQIIEAPPLPRPTFAGDTVHLPQDTTSYVVQPPIASWMLNADRRITWLTLLVQDTIRTAWAMLQEERDSLRRATIAFGQANLNLDSLATARLVEVNLLKARARRAGAPSSTRATLTYGTAFAAVDLGNRWLGIDRDAGGYRDEWTTSDKAIHALAASSLTLAAMNAGVKWKPAVIITCAGALGFEWSQGYASAKDAAASCAGSVASVAATKLFRRLVGQ